MKLWSAHDMLHRQEVAFNEEMARQNYDKRESNPRPRATYFKSFERRGPSGHPVTVLHCPAHAT
jgi:hypothetical protein